MSRLPQKELLAMVRAGFPYTAPERGIEAMDLTRDEIESRSSPCPPGP